MPPTVGFYGSFQTLFSLCGKADADHQVLHDTLIFCNGIIKKLYMFKDVTIKGELYFSEFRQNFKTDSLVCSLKDTSDGKFDFKIDGVM